VWPRTAVCHGSALGHNATTRQAGMQVRRCHNADSNAAGAGLTSSTDVLLAGRVGRRLASPPSTAVIDTVRLRRFGSAERFCTHDARSSRRGSLRYFSLLGRHHAAAGAASRSAREEGVHVSGVSKAPSPFTSSPVAFWLASWLPGLQCLFYCHVI
jgi:hypothetical protein